MTLPILDYDATPQAVIEPFRDQGFVLPTKMLFAFISASNIAQYVAQYPHQVVAEYDTISNHFDVYALTVAGQTIGLCQAPLGAPAATQLLDFLIGYGAQTIIAVGSCGVLTPTPENQLLVVTRALRDEGASYHYLPAAAEIALAPGMVNHLLHTLDQRAKAVATWTTDAYYRETSAKIQTALAAGFEVVEMECAALSACAQFRRVKFGQVLFTADSLASLSAYDAQEFGQAAHLPALTAVMRCLVADE